MALSEQTLDHLLEAEGNIRAAIKCDAVNEKPLVVNQISKLLYEFSSSEKSPTMLIKKSNPRRNKCP